MVNYNPHPTKSYCSTHTFLINYVVKLFWVTSVFYYRKKLSILITADVTDTSGMHVFEVIFFKYSVHFMCISIYLKLCQVVPDQRKYVFIIYEYLISIYCQRNVRLVSGKPRQTANFYLQKHSPATAVNILHSLIRVEYL